MVDNIPKSAPLTDKEKLIKPLEESSNTSSDANLNNNIFNESYKNQNVYDENYIVQELQRSFSNKVIQPKNKVRKKNLNLNMQSINTGVNVNIIEGVIPTRDKKKKFGFQHQKIPRTSPYNFKYFCNTANKKSINQALSNKSQKTENKVLESNFIKISKDANIYTSNATYITNKKMLLFDKYDFENNKYKPNRAKLFDMTAIPKSKNQIGNTLYKTTKFRGGKMFFFDNKTAPKILDEISDNDLNNKKPLYLRDLQRHETKMEEKMNEKQKIIKYVDNSFQKHKRYPPSNSLYKELMNKKNEIYDNFMQRLESGQDNIAPYIPSPISFPTGINDEEEKIKKVKNENLNGYSVLFSKKKNDGKIPITFPLICSNMIDCDSISQRARYENIMEAFIKLKSMIENDKNQGKFNERQYIIEFVANKNIDKEHLTEENLGNFSNFLNRKILPIDTNKTLKENILIALNYNGEDESNNNNLNNNTNTEQKLSPNDKKPSFNKNQIILTETNIFNKKPLEYDIPRQKKLLSEENFKNDYQLKNSLEKELEIIEDELENKQDKINKVEANLNLLPFESDYYYKHYLSLKKNKKEVKKDLRLISQKEFNRVNMEKNEGKRKVNNKYNLYNFNERLYYTWYKNNNIGDIKNYKKKTKLTEYIIYNRTKERILDEKLKEIAEKKSIKNKN
jgi:hypothetical protein